MLLGFSVSPACLPAIPCLLARAAAAMHSLLPQRAEPMRIYVHDALWLLTHGTVFPTNVPV
ncbi:hypothetical protein SNOG_01282 [Parastagonospora nodorum SN15]|uniref:Uncharacterized protein n=1 Tax=Phaeosphaeria nodorum (strain SN15 / ATCC MYA-4574 / FGSC 10173) TaxID=321614 RepID=Q0V3Y2_PHANO|nr:hypothetical protein SNOG_01282 [Parastagonospora nodorum SN15]EAT90931.1 hypothetical protein SNOG_01282 [Parastagonospora nodorum SN15]